MVQNLTCPIFDEDDYLLNPSLFDGCCTMGSILAFTIPPTICLALCVVVLYCFFIDSSSSKWKCTIIPGFFLVWSIMLVLFFSIFFATMFDGISLNMRYTETSGIICNMKMEEYSCQGTCYQLNIWIAYLRDQELAFSLDRGIVFTTKDRIEAEMLKFEAEGTITIWYDPLLDNVISLEKTWSKSFQLGIIAASFSLVGWLICSGCLLYFQVIPWLKETYFEKKDRESQESLELDRM